MAQVRYVNESQPRGKKSNSKEKEIKRLLSKRRVQSMKNLNLSEVMVQWIEESKASPPVRAVTSIIKANGEVLTQVPVTEETAAADVLKVSSSVEPERAKQLAGCDLSRFSHLCHVLQPLDHESFSHVAL